MFSKIWTKTSTPDSSGQIERLKKALHEADAVVIGAGSGLSTAAGFSYAGERFDRHFSDFAEKYGFSDMYTGGFHPFRDREEFWAYWSRCVYINRYQSAPRPTYENLLQLVSGKEYFVLTTNVDHCFQKAGFDKARLFYTQGDYGLFQCSGPCCQETHDNEPLIREMVQRQKDMRIPSELLPLCPHCHRPMAMNLRIDHTFVEDAGWHQAAERYKAFLHTHDRQRVVFLELGVGFNTPVIIKYPFWQMTHANPRATYACINRDEAYIPEEISARGIGIRMDINQVLQELQF